MCLGVPARDKPAIPEVRGQSEQPVEGSALQPGHQRPPSVPPQGTKHLPRALPGGETGTRLRPARPHFAPSPRQHRPAPGEGCWDSSRDGCGENAEPPSISLHSRSLSPLGGSRKPQRWLFQHKLFQNSVILATRERVPRRKTCRFHPRTLRPALPCCLGSFTGHEVTLCPP